MLGSTDLPVKPIYLELMVGIDWSDLAKEALPKIPLVNSLVICPNASESARLGPQTSLRCFPDELPVQVSG